MKYTKHQQKAIEHWEENLHIIACDGSVKTDVITRRIAKHISTGVPKESIVAFTFAKNPAEEIFHLTNIQFLLADNPFVEKAQKLLGRELSDRTKIRPDSFNLEKVKNDFFCKEAEAYHGPLELTEIRTKKKSTWVYAWNEKLKSLCVREFMDELPAELEKAKPITLLSGEILGYKNCTNMEDAKFGERFNLKMLFLVSMGKEHCLCGDKNG